jgi:UDP-N-acetylglucosamine 2-epimerase (non-hydrolysing)
MKIAPIMLEMSRYPGVFKQVLVHTGQHYDGDLSGVFFDHLKLRAPDVNLDVGSGTHAQQTARVMIEFEPVLKRERPDWVVVVGDVNSTLACALTAAKMGVAIAHVEAGLRSFDRTMPEEVNRTVVDHLADLLFTTEPSANRNLRNEGIPRRRVHFAGNVMIDTLVRFRAAAKARLPELRRKLGVDRYVLATLHRPSNVDDAAALSEILSALGAISQVIPVVFPVHPRTQERIGKRAERCEAGRMILTRPLGYVDFLALESEADVVLTDSGGVQEETSYLGVPCVTIRPSTERPITVTHGTNRLVRCRRPEIVREFNRALDSSEDTLQRSRRCARVRKFGRWDGRAASRIVSALRKVAADGAR